MGTSHSWSAGERGEQAQFNGQFMGSWRITDFTHLWLLLVLTGSSHVHVHSLTHTQTLALLFKVARALLLWQPSLIRAAMRRCRCEKSPNVYSQADIVRLFFFSARCPQGQHCQHSAIVVLSFFEDTLFCSIARHSLLYSGFRAISGMDSGKLPLIIAAV